MRPLGSRLFWIPVALLFIWATLGVSVAQDHPHQHGATTPDHADSGVEMMDADKIRVLLSAHCSFPTREELVAISADAPALLMEIFNDPNALPSVRMRALDALGYFNTPETESFLVYLLENHGQLETRHLHHAITAYGKVAGERSIPAVRGFLEHADVQVRMTVIDALRSFAGQPGRELLQQRLAVEPNRVVKERLELGVR